MKKKNKDEILEWQAVSRTAITGCEFSLQHHDEIGRYFKFSTGIINKAGK